MSLKIRLARGGTKKRPHYSIVVADARSPRDGRFIEKLGTFDPLKAKDAADRVVLNLDKAKQWMVNGAQPTDRVARFLDAAGVLKREARHNPIKAMPKKKAQERVAANEKAAEAAQGRHREGESRCGGRSSRAGRGPLGRRDPDRAGRRGLILSFSRKREEVAERSDAG